MYNKPKPRILAILEPYPEIGRLLRLTKRKAQLENVDWEVLYVETPDLHRKLDSHAKQNLLSTLTLAEQMGAIVTRIRAKSRLAGIKEVIREREAHQIPIHSIKVPEMQNSKVLPLGRPLTKSLRRIFNTYNIRTIPISWSPVIYKRFTNILKI